MKQIKTLADVQAVPANEWIVRFIKDGKCPYCGKALLVYQDCHKHYGACDCKVGQAVEQHNQAILESRKK
ncbi:MAG: hypothetical protein IJ660_07315 [Alphaproteobacteria bacterium]|nr:hypothetical protein [Alphaproteobacteria bacterium]